MNLESHLDRNAKVMACPSDGPEKIRMGALGGEHDCAVGEHKLAGDHVVVQEAVLALQSSQAGAEGNANDACRRA